MVESIDNYIQLAILGLCFGISLFKAVTKRRRSWVLVSVFYSAFFLGSLYWELFYYFRGDTPSKFYVAEFDWYVSYLFLFLFMKYQSNIKTTAKKSRIRWLVPVFAGGLSVYYMTFGQISSNIISAILMSMLGMAAVKGLFSDDTKMKPVYIATLVFFFLEYAMWTVSCLIDEVSFSNPYYYIDMAVSLCLFVMLLCFMKVLKDEVDE